MRPTSRLATLASMVVLVAPFGVAVMAAPAGAVGTPAPGGPAATTSQWPQFGHSPRHLGTNPAEKAFNTGNVSQHAHPVHRRLRQQHGSPKAAPRSPTGCCTRAASTAA